MQTSGLGHARVVRVGALQGGRFQELCTECLLNVRSSRAWPASAIFRGVLPTLCGDGTDTTWAEQLCGGDEQVDGQDDEVAHAAHRSMTATAHKTAPHGRIPSYCEFATDRLNNKIRVIQRRAYGLRDEEYLRLKIVTCTLPQL